jgi:putative hemolysin
LFSIDPGFKPVLTQSLELGRSFIIPEYQKKRLPLFMLWKGILFYLLKKPGYRYLIGPVSISKFYSGVSKSVIVEFVRRYYYLPEFAQYVKPLTPYKPELRKVDLKNILKELGDDVEKLDNFIEQIEPNHFRLPVLLKQYVRQNARFIGFNLDPNFNNALDGLMILDVRQARQETIENLKRTW